MLTSYHLPASCLHKLFTGLIGGRHTVPNRKHVLTYVRPGRSNGLDWIHSSTGSFLPSCVQVLIMDSCDGLGCNPSCPSELLLPAGRDETDGMVVWAVVLATFACALLVLGGGNLV